MAPPDGRGLDSGSQSRRRRAAPPADGPQSPKRQRPVCIVQPYTPEALVEDPLEGPSGVPLIDLADSPDGWRSIRQPAPSFPSYAFDSDDSLPPLESPSIVENLLRNGSGEIPDDSPPQNGGTWWMDAPGWSPTSPDA